MERKTYRLTLCDEQGVVLESLHVAVDEDAEPFDDEFCNLAYPSEAEDFITDLKKLIAQHEAEE